MTCGKTSYSACVILATVIPAATHSTAAPGAFLKSRSRHHFALSPETLPCRRRATQRVTRNGLAQYGASI
jgi:hypothetical protein